MPGSGVSGPLADTHAATPSVTLQGSHMGAEIKKDFNLPFPPTPSSRVSDWQASRWRIDIEQPDRLLTYQPLLRLQGHPVGDQSNAFSSKARHCLAQQSIKCAMQLSVNEEVVVDDNGRPFTVP